MTSAGDPVPEPRPPSPFLILLLGAAATALAGEWLRFGWGPWVAAGPAALGATATILGVGRAFRRRRAWRERRRDGSTTPERMGERALAPAPPAPDTILSVRSGEGRLRPAGRRSAAPAAAAPRHDVRAARSTAQADDPAEGTSDAADRPLADRDTAPPRRPESAVR